MTTIEVLYFCFRVIIEIAKLILKYTNRRKPQKKDSL